MGRGWTLTSIQHVIKDLLSQSSYTDLRLGRFALVSQDMGLFRFWLQCFQEAFKMERNDDAVATGFYAQEFQFALKCGYLAEIAEMIETAGAELPLDALLKSSGKDKLEKPKYYQGLSIGGKKMTAWAREHSGDNYRTAMSKSTPPLLQAAHAGNIAAVQFFLSDIPSRLYDEYEKKNKGDPRLRKLSGAFGGYHSAVGNWLLDKSEFSFYVHASKLDDIDLLLQLA